MHDDPAHTTAGGRAFVLGLDGVPWNLLERWASAGELPNFGRLLTEGAAGPLESTTPATTALAWPSLATGVAPDGHGLYSFRRLKPDYTHRMNTSGDVAAPTLWDLLSPAVVGNVPMTYPAREIDGELVTGMMTPTFDERATHPPELAAEIRERIPEYRVGLDWNEYTDRPEELVADLDAVVEARRALMRRLMEREDWRLFFFVYTAPDRLQHLVWDEERILDHYRTLDDVLGEVLAYVTEREATLFVVSDHGFGPVSRVVHVNAALERAGYLRRAPDAGARGALARFGIGKSTIRAAIDRVGIDESAMLRRLPEPLVERVAAAVPGDHVLFDVDYGRTTAFCYGAGTVYINDTERFEQGCVDPAEVPRVREELAALLRTLRDPATGDRVLRVYDGAILYPDDDASPDLVVRGVDDYHVSTSLTEAVFGSPETLNASHRSQGVGLAWGPDIEPGATASDASVVDIAPTLLHALGEPVPGNVDGRVLTEWFAPDSDAATRDIDYRDPDVAGGATPVRVSETATEDETEAVEERLRGLGYLD